MAKKTYLHRGLITKLTPEQAKEAKVFDLERWWKETANKLFVPFNDTCNLDCPVPLGQPVRVLANVLSTYNGEEWITLSSVASAVTVTQETSKTTAVVANGSKGVVTTVALTDALDTAFVFTLTNSSILPTSVIQLTPLNSGTGIAHLGIVSIGTGSAVIRVSNVGVAPFNAALKIHFNIS
jgi:hypothetical protein